KYHTDTQKMLIAKIGGFLDTTCSAICYAWGQWQKMAAMPGIIVNGPVAMGGQIVGPAMQPFILQKGAKDTPNLAKFTNVIATVSSTAWLAFPATVKVTGLPWYPSFAMVTAPVAPPMQNLPCTFAELFQAPVSIAAPLMKTQMIGMLGDPQAPFAPQIF